MVSGIFLTRKLLRSSTAHARILVAFFSDVADVPDNLDKEKLACSITSLATAGSGPEALARFKTAIARLHLPLDLPTCNVLMASLRPLDQVLFVYKEMVKAAILPDAHTINHIIRALVDDGRLDAALCQFTRMHRKGCAPNSRTFATLIRGLSAAARADDAAAVHRQALLSGCDLDAEFLNDAIPRFCALGMLPEAEELMGRTRAAGIVPDPVALRSFLGCLCAHGRAEEAARILAGTAEFDPEAHDLLLRHHCDAGRIPEVVNLVERMAAAGIASGSSWSAVVRGLCEKVEDDESKQRALPVLVKRLIASASREPDASTCSALVAALSKLGRHASALNCFRRLCAADGRPLDSASYGELLRGLCRRRMVDEAAELFRWMSARGASPDAPTLHLLIDGACGSGRSREAIRWRSLALSLGTPSGPDTLASIIQSLPGSGRAKHLLALLSQMIVEGRGSEASVCGLLARSLCAENMAREVSLLFARMVRDDIDGFLACPDTALVEMVVNHLAGASILHCVAGALMEVARLGDDGVISPAACSRIVSGLAEEGRKREACEFLDLMLERGWVVSDARTYEWADRYAGVVIGTGEEDEVATILEDGLR